MENKTKVGENMKEILKKSGETFLVYLLLFVILISTYMIVMTLSSLIPTRAIESNVKKSSETLVSIGERGLYSLPYKDEVIFTFTDALMINTAYSISPNRPIQSFLMARKNYIPGQTKIIYHDSQYNLGANEKYRNARTGDLYQTKELYGLMHGDNIEDSYEYARYWHGYLAILRPMLVLFDYSTIRIILFIVTMLLIGILLFLLYKKVNLMSAIIFAIGLVSINIWIVTQSINEILIFLVAFTSSIILLLKYKKIKRAGVFFFIVGSVSSFIDLLTAPVVTLGITMVIYFLLLQKEEKPSLDLYFKRIFEIGASWCLGYGLTWAVKWVIVELFFDNRPMLSQVLEQIRFRSKIPVRNSVPMASRWSVISRNLAFLSKPVTKGVAVACVLLAIVMRIVKRKKKLDFKENIRSCIPYIVIFFIPFVWFIIISQHSYTHAFFVYRTLMIAIVSLLLVVYKIFEKEKEIEKK